MFENYITKIYRFIKKIGLNKLGFIFILFLIKPIIFVFAKTKKLSLFPQENWGTKLRYLLGWYEHETVIISKKYIKPGMKILDIGGDIGYFTRLFSKLTGQTGTVWVFEPEPNSYKMLRKNISSSKYKNVISIPKALSDKEEIVTLFQMDVPAKHSFYNTSKINNEIKCKKEIKIHATTIDNFLELQGNPKIDFIKMDIEGAEPKALKGMLKTAKKSRKLIMLIEYNARALELGGSTALKFLKQIYDMGFTIQAILSGGELKEIDKHIHIIAKEGYINLLCVKTTKH